MSEQFIHVIAAAAVGIVVGNTFYRIAIAAWRRLSRGTDRQTEGQS